MPSADSEHVPTSFTWSQWGNHICIAGSFDPPTPVWTPIEMPKNKNDVNEVILDLIPNKKYCYKFVIDGEWVLDPSISSFPDESGNYNHEILVEPPPPPPLPSEKVVVESQQELEEQKDDQVVIDHHQEEKVITEHYQEDKVVTDDYQKEHCQDNQVIAEEQKGDHQEEKVVVENNQENQVIIEDKKEHYRYEEEQITTEEDERKDEQHMEDYPPKNDVVMEHEEYPPKDEVVTEQVVTDEHKDEQHMEENPPKDDVVTEHDITDENKNEQHMEENPPKDDVVTEHVVTDERRDEQHMEENPPKDDVVMEHAKTDEHKDEHHMEENPPKDGVVMEHAKTDEHKDEQHMEDLPSKDEVVTEQVVTDEHKDEQHMEENPPKDDVVTEHVVTDERKDELHIEEEHVVNDDHKHEEEEEKTKEIVDEVCAESIVTKEILESSTESSGVVHSEQLRDDSVITEKTGVSTLEPKVMTTETETIVNEMIVGRETHSDLMESSSIVKETIIESDNEKLSAEYVANKESVIEKTHDIVIDDEIPKESQYTSSTTHDDLMTSESNETSINPVTKVENAEEFNITNEQTNEEMTSSNQDEGTSPIMVTTQETIDSEIISNEKEEIVSGVNVEELNKEVKLRENVVDDSKEPIIEQSVVVDDESKVTEFIEEKFSSINEKDTIISSSIKISDSTTDVDSEIETHFTETIMPTSEINYERDYEPELDPINENEDTENEDEDKFEDNKEYKNEYTDDIENTIRGEYSDGVSPETLKEVLLNHTWAKDESMDETIPESWLESNESTGYVWSEQLEWQTPDDELNQEQVTSTWTIEENRETNDEIKSREISSTEKIITKQDENPYSTNINENLESTITEIPAQQIIYNNESNVEHKTREIIVEETIEKTKEFDNEIRERENIISTSEVKVAEPSSVSTVQYEKPESSATADEKISSMPTTVVAPANEQEMMFNTEDVLKLIGKQVEESQSISTGVNNIPPGKISQRNIISISPNASSPGESTRNADMYAHNKTVATNTSREIMSPTKETVNIKSNKHKKPPIEISTSREILQKDPKYVSQQHMEKIDLGIVYLMTSLATTFALGIISMLFKSVFGERKNKGRY